MLYTLNQQLVITTTRRSSSLVDCDSLHKAQLMNNNNCQTMTAESASGWMESDRPTAILMSLSASPASIVIDSNITAELLHSNHQTV